MDYLEFKKNWENGWRDKSVLFGCFVLVFLVGFGTGKYEKLSAAPAASAQSHYITKAAAQPQQNPPAAGAVAGAQTTASAGGNCVVKGNISATGKKIYHVAGGAFYKTVKPEQCFNTEADALAAGFVKSGR